MAVLVDSPIWPAHGRLWAHLVSDTSLEELHSFAQALGIPERGFDLDHYDIPEEYVPKADGRSARFYSVVARDTVDQDFAAHRQRFLAEQGYAYRIVDADDVFSGTAEI